MKYCTYIYRDPKTLVPRYVGKGQYGRPFKHLRKSSNLQLGRMLKKRIFEGFDPQPIIIEASSNEDAVEMECLLIEMIGRADIKTGPLFNYTSGGEGSQNLSPAMRAKKSQSASIAQSNPEIKAKQRLAQQIANMRPGVKERRGLAIRKACTVDGILIFSSCKELVESLGQGKAGRKSPSFRYL